MKLKRLFWAKGFLLADALFGILCISSCSSTKFSVPIPGRNDAVITNIYAEYLNIADIYFGLEKFDKAETYYKAAMGNNDIYWTAFYKLAKCYVYESKWGDAQASYETILKRDPENNSIKASIAYIYAMNGNPEKASDIYKELIESNPDQMEYLENYICVLLASDQKDQAKESFEQLKEKFPESKRIEEISKQFPTDEDQENLENPESIDKQ